MAVTERDRNRARGHMGYGGVQQSSTFVLGVPAGVQTAFMIEGAWARILPSAEGAFVELLDKLDRVEHQMEENQDDLAVKKLGNIETNLEEFEGLLKRYFYWQGKLANLLQVPPNPFDQRFAGYSGGGGGINASVSG
jgi:hypothetical protein